MQISKGVVTVVGVLVLLQPVAAVTGTGGGLSAVDPGTPEGNNTVLVDVSAADLPGNGTEEDPYRISNVSELQAIEDVLYANYTLVSDIDASGTAQANGGKGFDPIGEFAGTLDGQGYSITNLTINRSDTTNVGLFGSLGGEIRNLQLRNLSVTGSGDVGGLAGYSEGWINNVTVTGEVDGDSDVGGVVGVNRGNLEDISANTEVSGSQNLGGIVGWHKEGILLDISAASHVTGDDKVGGVVGKSEARIRNATVGGEVDGSTDVGGLVGSNDNEVEDVSASADVDGYSDVGGLLGEHSGTVRDASASGTVTGSKYVGGLIGANAVYAETQDVSATGQVDGDQNVGGLAGISYRPIRDALATGAVNGTKKVGGLVGHNEGRIENASARGRVTGSENVGGLVGYNHDNTTIQYVTASGDVAGSKRVGGLVGSQGLGMIKIASANGSVSGSTEVGGLVGNNGGDIRNVSAVGNVAGSSGVGGLVGINSHQIQDAFAAGNVTGESEVGGLVGNTKYGSVQDAYWDVLTTNQSTSPGSATGLVTSEMTGKAARPNMSGLAFKTVWRIQPRDYPELRALSAPPASLPEVVVNESKGTATLYYNAESLDTISGAFYKIFPANPPEYRQGPGFIPGPGTIPNPGIENRTVDLNGVIPGSSNNAGLQPGERYVFEAYVRTPGQGFQSYDLARFITPSGPLNANLQGSAINATAIKIDINVTGFGGADTVGSYLAYRPEDESGSTFTGGPSYDTPNTTKTTTITGLEINTSYSITVTVNNGRGGTTKETITVSTSN